MLGIPNGWNRNCFSIQIPHPAIVAPDKIVISPLERTFAVIAGTGPIYHVSHY